MNTLKNKMKMQKNRDFLKNLIKNSFDVNDDKLERMLDYAEYHLDTERNIAANIGRDIESSLAMALHIYNRLELDGVEIIFTSITPSMRMEIKLPGEFETIPNLQDALNHDMIEAIVESINGKLKIARRIRICRLASEMSIDKNNMTCYTYSQHKTIE